MIRFLLSIAMFLPCTVGDFELCNPGESKYVYQFMSQNCPFGVLFYSPISVKCLASTNARETFVSDLCNASRVPISMTERPYKIHLVTKMDKVRVSPENSCYGIGQYRCDAEVFVQATSEVMTPPQSQTCDEVDAASNPEDVLNQNVAIFNETERLFRFMFGLIGDEEGTSPPDLRVIKLLRSTFRIFRKFVPNEFVSRTFLKDVEKAFLFLFQNSDLNFFMDTGMEDYLLLEKTLKTCESMAAPFTVIGKFCETCSEAYGIAKDGKMIRYEVDDFAFEWGKYDVPVDATWSIITFAHGLCYGTYKLYVNFHHLYGQEMERLFRPEILHRWINPTMLYNEDLWDHAFSTNVRSAMKVLDVSVFGAYHETPFLHPLERPVSAGTQTIKSEKRRRRRSLAVPEMSLDNGGLRGAGWCFQTEDEQYQTIKSYIRHHCPSVSFPAEIELSKDIRNKGLLSTKPVQTTSDEFAHL